MSVKQITSHNQFMSIVGTFIAIDMTPQLIAVTTVPITDRHHDGIILTLSDDGRREDSLRRLRL